MEKDFDGKTVNDHLAVCCQAGQSPSASEKVK